MKKSLFLASLALVLANASGITTDLSSSSKYRNMREVSFSQPIENSEQSTRRGERLQLEQALQQSLQEASTSSNTGERSFEDFLQQNTESEESILQQTSPEKLEKIENYLRQRKPGIKYSLDLLREAMVHYCLHTETSIAEIAKDYGIDRSYLCHRISEAKISRPPSRKLTEEQISRALEKRREKKALAEAAETNGMARCTLLKYAKKRGENPLRNKIDKEKILELYKNGKTFKDFYELITSGENNAKKKLAEVISEKMTDLQKNRLVSENMDIIEDYREKLLTDKGRLDKYKNREIQIGDLCMRRFGECEDYLIRNIALKLGYDLSKLPVEWNIEYESINDVPDYMKQSVIDEFNKGFLSINGISAKYKIKTVKALLNRKYVSLPVQRRIATQTSYKYADISRVTKEKLQNKYGYASSTAIYLKRNVDQYNKLSPDQKKMFKNILDSDIRIMPSNEDLDKIKPLKYGNNRLNEKFRKLLLVLCNREDEIKTTRTTINQLKQQLDIWKKLAKKENDQTD